MIHTLAAFSSPGADMPGTVGAGSKSDASPFMALFAQALTEQGAVAGKATNPLLSALLGKGGAPETPAGFAWGAVGGLTDLASALSGARAEAGLRFSGLGAAAVPTESGAEMSPVSSESGTELAAEADTDLAAVPLFKDLLKGEARTDIPVDFTSGDPALTAATLPSGRTEPGAEGQEILLEDVLMMSMQGMPFLSPGAALTTAPSVANKEVDGDQGVALAAEVEVELGAEGGKAGKNLPGQLATIAGRQDPGLSQSPVKESDAGLPGPVSTQAASKQFDAMLSNVMPASSSAPDGLTASVAGQSASPLPVSGQEAALMSSRAAGSTAMADKVAIPMQSGFGTQAWQQEFGDRLVWLAGRQGQTAELILNPPSLGAVEVRLNLTGGEASAQFFSANPNVRDVLEAALPKLRELMGGAGISLGEATVSNQSFGQRQAAQQEKNATPDNDFVLIEDAGALSRPIRAMGTSLLDYFA